LLRLHPSSLLLRHHPRHPLFRSSHLALTATALIAKAI
jgi:hypothetical protein